MTSDVATRGSAHPWSLDSMRAYTVPASPAADKAAPATSRRAWRLGRIRGLHGNNQNVNAKPMHHRDGRQGIDPSPAQKVHGQAAQQRTERECGTGPGGPGPDGCGTIRAIERRIDQSEGPGHQKRRTEPLDDAPGDQQDRRGRAGRQHRAGPEGHQPETDDRHSPEQIGDGAARQNHRGLRQQIAVDHPLL